MDADRWARIEELCHAAFEHPEEEQTAFLAGACGTDQDLRREVESLLAHRQRAENFMEGRAVEMAARVLVADHAASGSDSYFIGRLVSHYRIVEKVASGGMGDVYRAVRADGSYDKQVAIKVIQGARSTDFFRARFQNERQILATLDHPNIARLLDGGTTEEGLPYVVMEYVQGLPIDKFCARKGLGVDGRLTLFRTVCSAVQYAHQNLVVHRDLKPSNILVTAEGIPKLLDFGIAKILHPQHGEEALHQTVTLLRLLTPDYASPEQVRNEPISTSSDVYSLGVILYRLLTGSNPYRLNTDSPQEMMRAICETEPERPSTAVMRTEAGDGTPREEGLASARAPKGGEPTKLGKTLKGDLDNIVLKALRKEPQRRYSSVEQFSEDVRRYLAGLPVLAHKDSPGYRASKFISRHTLGVGSAAVVVIAALAGMAAILYEAHIARVQRLRAEARFNDVRVLANSLMFDVHDSIQDLPGSTPARKMLVDRALRYLDSLSRDVASDASLQRELATAYEKVGTVQGDAFGANLGDTGGALDSYRKAEVLRESLLKTDRQSVDDVIALARVQRLIGGVLANRGDPACLSSLREAVATAERAIQIASPSESVAREVQADYRFLGTLLDGAGDYQASAENFQKASQLIDKLLRAAPDDRVLRRDSAAVETRWGHELASAGSRKEGTPHLQRAIDILALLSAGSQDAEATRRLAITHSYLAEALVADGDPASALPQFKESLRIAKRIAAADPRNAVAQLDLAFALATLGNATALNGQPAAGLDMLNQASKMFQGQLARDPAYAEPLVDLTLVCIWSGETLSRIGQRARALESYQEALAAFRDYALRNKGTVFEANLALIYTDIGSSLTKLGKPAQALPEFEQARTSLESLIGANPNILEARYVLAYTYSSLGDLFQSLSSDLHRPLQQRIHDLNQARDWLQRSVDTWQKIPSAGARTPMGFECGSPKNVARELAKCEAALGKLNRPDQPVPHRTNLPPSN